MQSVTATPASELVGEDRRPGSQLGEAALAAQLRRAGLAAPVAVERLVFNPNNPVTATVERVDLDDGSSVVRKVLCRDRPTTVPHWPAGRGVDHWNHWRREACAHDSGLTSVFADAGVRAPRLLGRDTPADGVEVLFCEHVEGRSGAALDGDDLVAVAGSLAVGTGATTARVAGAEPWWSRQWIRRYALSRPPGPAVHADAVAWEHPVVVAGFGDERHRLRARFGEVLVEAPRWFDLLDRLPMGVAHLDCWANNIVVPPGRPGAGPGAAESPGRPGVSDGGAFLLDWAFAGVAPVGVDVGNLVPDGLVDLHLDPSDWPALDARLWEALAGGLEAVGWREDPGLARLAMCLAVLRFVWMPALMVHNAGFTGPTAYGAQDGPDLVEVFRRRLPTFDGMLDRLDEARSLAASLGLPW